jgi:hypothetical protein
MNSTLPPHHPARVVATDGYFDPDLSNGLRARAGGEAVNFYRTQRGMDSEESVNAVDLLTDLLHYLHSLGEDPILELRKAERHFAREAGGTNDP